MSNYVTLGERILNRFGYRSETHFNAAIQEAVKLEIDKVHHWLAETADAQRFDVPDPEIYANQADMYRLSPLLGTALDILGDDVGLSKFNVKRMVGEEEREIPNHALELLLRTPNPMDSGLEFMRATTIGYKLNGNYIWWLNCDGETEKPNEIWPIPYQMVKPVPDKQLYLSHYEYYPGMGKEAILLPIWQIVHFKTYNPNSRYMGLSPMESLAMTLVGNQGMRKTKAKQYTDYGGSPPSILAFKDWVSNEAWNEVNLKIKNAATKNEMMTLRGTGDGVSWMSRALSSRDAEFIANLESDMVDVFNRMAPGLLAMLDKSATEANALAARATYSEKSQWKTLETFAQKITSDILPRYGRNLKGEFDDPRVVDRRLEMEELNMYSKTHTIDQINEKYYQEPPLGDDRGNMFIFENKSGDIAFGGSLSTEAETPADIETVEDTGSDDLTMKAALDELMTWRRIALRGKALKAQNFLCAYVPREVSSNIKRTLPAAKNQDEIAIIFNDAADRLRVQPKMDAIDLIAQELKRANDLLASAH